MRVRQVRKRDGRLVPFDRRKIAEAIFRAAQSVDGEDRFLAEQLAGVVTSRLQVRLRASDGADAPSIEDVQDVVERVLIDAGHAKTAKAYILYRRRRAEARAARAAVDAETEHAAATGVPLVGGDSAAAEAGLERWSKSRLVERLMDREQLAQPEAEALARAVEERVMRAEVPRVSRELVDVLVRAELFDRGWTARSLKPLDAAVPAAQVHQALTQGLTDRRATDPAVLTEGVGETLVAQHLLDRLLAPAVAEAHRTGDLHIYDLGAPLRLSSVALLTPEAAERALMGESFTHTGAARRAVAALEVLLLKYAPHAGRVLSLEAVNVWLAPFFAHLDEDALAEEIRHFLLSPTVAAVGRRGGTLRLELGLTSEVPAALRAVDVPAPAPPGRRYGDYADEALRVTRAMLHEASDLRRRAHWVDLSFTLVLTRGEPRDAARRALVRQALAAAGEGGEPIIVFDDRGRPSRGSRWFRLRENDSPDPLRFDRGDVSSAGSVAVNLVAAAMRTRQAGLDDFIREADRLVAQALDAAVAQRSLLSGPVDAPGGALYALRRGMHPLVDLEAAFHLVEVVGADQAAALLLPDAESLERIGMRERIVKHLHARVRAEALSRRIHAALAEGLSHEAGARFARIDGERYPEVAGWWEQGAGPAYGLLEAAGLTREPLHPDRLHGGPSFLRVRHRVGGGREAPVDDLLTALEAAEQDEAVVEYAVDPWPKRLVHGDG